ncbi:MAG TPA: 8-amino-7-oxononanoate synthase [Myxococcales bacterium]|nr:8-amino-7-oxononanoate synthase [Myxococcales bacterium]
MGLADGIAQEELAALRARGLLRSLEPLLTRAGAEIELRPGERLINLSSNDYLGLAGDGRIAAALAEGAARWGAGAGASRLVCGDFAVEHELEAALARFDGAEAAMLFGSGYAANCGLLPAFAGPGDLIASDELNHASIIDGCRLSRARVEVYPHGDVEAAARLLQLPARRRLLVTDAVFSMDGDVAPLRELSAVCEERGAILVVDEAHATGVVELPVAAEIRMSTHSKGLGLVGAHVAGSPAVCDLLVNRARPLVFSTGLPPAVAHATLAALRIVEGAEGAQRRARLFRNVARFSEGLKGLGLPVAKAVSPIIPLVLGDPDTALRVASRLRELGVLAKAIRPPTVPAGTSRIRFALSAAHTDAHLEAALDALRKAL